MRVIVTRRLAYWSHMEAMMPKPASGPIADDKPLKVTGRATCSLSIPGPAGLRPPMGWRSKVSPVVDPARLIVPMLQRFIATDRGFAKARRTLTPGSAD